MTLHRPMTQRRPPIGTTAPRSHIPRRVVAAFLVLVAALGLIAALLPGHHEAIATARTKTLSRPTTGSLPTTTVSLPTRRPAPTALAADQIAAQVAEAVVLGTSPPSEEVTAALWKRLQTRRAARVYLAAGTISVFRVGIDGTDQLFEVVVTPLNAGPVPVDVVVIETDGRPRVAALPGIAG